MFKHKLHALLYEVNRFMASYEKSNKVRRGMGGYRTLQTTSISIISSSTDCFDPLHTEHRLDYMRIQELIRSDSIQSKIVVNIRYGCLGGDEEYGHDMRCVDLSRKETDTLPVVNPQLDVSDVEPG